MTHPAAGPGDKGRLERYFEFLQKDYADNLLRNNEYSLDLMHKDQVARIKSGQYKTYLFVGMGCSAVVSFVIRAFFQDLVKKQNEARERGEKVQGTSQPLPYIDIANDYDLEYWTNMEALRDGTTLVVLTSYSGYSIEPVFAYEKIRKYTDNIVFLTSGGNLIDLAKRDNISMMLYKVTRGDREYPLFHLPQYFAILLDVFEKLGVLSSNYNDVIKETVPRLTLAHDRTQLARHIASDLIDRNIIILTTAKWFMPLTHAFDMHFNEIAMVPSHANYIHEFSHSEVATCSDPSIKHALLIFKEETEDGYTTNKINNIQNLFSNAPNVIVFIITLKNTHFIEQFFDILLFVQYIVYYLGSHYNTQSRELISLTTGNSYYSTSTIKAKL
jgi:glucose/mannose-6-phosphate isomerase